MTGYPSGDLVDATVHAAREVSSPWHNRDRATAMPGPRAQAIGALPMSRPPRSPPVPAPLWQPMSTDSLPIGYPLVFPYMKSDFAKAWGATSPVQEFPWVHFKGQLEGAVGGANPVPTVCSRFTGGTWGGYRGRVRSTTGPVRHGEGTPEARIFKPHGVGLLGASDAVPAISPKQVAFGASDKWEGLEEQTTKQLESYTASPQNWRPSWPCRPILCPRDIPYAFVRVCPGLKVLSSTEFRMLQRQIPRWGLERGRTDFKRHKRICRRFLEVLAATECGGPFEGKSPAPSLGRGSR